MSAETIIKLRIQDIDEKNERDCSFIIEKDIFHSVDGTQSLSGIRFYELNWDTPESFVVLNIYNENGNTTNFHKNSFDDRPLVSNGVLIFNDDSRLSNEFKKTMRLLISTCLMEIEFNKTPTFSHVGKITTKDGGPLPIMKFGKLLDYGTIEFASSIKSLPKRPEAL